MDQRNAAFGSGGEQRPRFHGAAGAMAPTVVKGLLLTVVTLGIYRFWYQTDIRRFLWSRTEIDNDNLEYLGRGVELFIGFLIALAVLIPFYGLVFLAATLAGPIGGVVAQVATTIGLVFLAQFALYRARRYRLTRTVWRGIRFQQTGSGLAYAGRSFLWAFATILTLGLAYPWGRASLERYKMDHTAYGDQQGSFAATGGQLFKRGVLLWLLAVVLILGPMVVGGVVAAQLGAGGSPGGAQGGALGAMLALPALLGLLVVPPLYQAVEYRWWANGCRIGPAAARCDLGLFAFFGVYVRFLLVMLLFSAIVGLVIFAIVLAVGGLPAIQEMAESAESAGSGAGVVLAIVTVAAYFLFVMGAAGLWQLFGARSLWRRSFESVAITGLPALMAAQSLEPVAGAFGEGVADALDFGGF
ncbi:DUF898 family protein [Hansschlegelia sp. KR7-227]|uniref:DUF898 family protein n=1 Tax=Hansschlegelia sp. KR7-227 TaxID=3400914 RepID=UPI003BFC95D1